MGIAIIEYLSYYRDDNLPDDTVPKYWGHRVHKEDILCLAYCEPNILVSASYDGDIIVWDVDGEKKLIQMSAHNDASRSGKKLAPHQMHSKAMKDRIKKANSNAPSVNNSPASSSSDATSNSSTPVHHQLKTVTPTNRPSSKLKDRTATYASDMQPCLKDWDKENMSFTDRAVEKVSV